MLLNHCFASKTSLYNNAQVPFGLSGFDACILNMVCAHTKVHEEDACIIVVHGLAARES